MNPICTVNNSSSISFALLFLGFISVHPSQCVHIHFFNTAEVRNEKILLGDIAHISIKSDCNVKSFYRFSNLYVGEAAPAGYTRYVDAHDVLQNYIKTQYNHISIGGAKRVKVRTDAYFKTVGDYENQIVTYIRTNIHWPQKDVVISLRNPDKKWRCFKRDFNVTFEGIKTPFPKGNIQFSMKIAQGEKIQSIPVLCNIKINTSVVSVAEHIPRNEIIEKKHLRLIPRDITHFKYTPFTSASSVLGNIAVKTLSPGTILHQRCIKPVPDILRGERVDIVLQKGRIKLSVSGRAREEGIKGDIIWVENIQSHKLMKVIILGKGLVSPAKGESI
jgi:flagella basal body P-ring formation protein FlgA